MSRVKSRLVPIFSPDAQEEKSPPPTDASPAAAQISLSAGNVDQAAPGASPAPEPLVAEAPTAAPAMPPPSPVALTHEMIAVRAYYIWEHRGRPHGMDDQNWFDAEAQLRAELGW